MFQKVLMESCEYLQIFFQKKLAYIAPIQCHLSHLSVSSILFTPVCLAENAHPSLLNTRRTVSILKRGCRVNTHPKNSLLRVPHLISPIISFKFITRDLPNSRMAYQCPKMYIPLSQMIVCRICKSDEYFWVY